MFIIEKIYTLKLYKLDIKISFFKLNKQLLFVLIYEFDLIGRLYFFILHKEILKEHV